MHLCMRTSSAHRGGARPVYPPPPGARDFKKFRMKFSLDRIDFQRTWDPYAPLMCTHIHAATYREFHWDSIQSSVHFHSQQKLRWKIQKKSNSSCKHDRTKLIYRIWNRMWAQSNQCEESLSFCSNMRTKFLIDLFRTFVPSVTLLESINCSEF